MRLFNGLLIKSIQILYAAVIFSLYFTNNASFKRFLAEFHTSIFLFPCLPAMWSLWKCMKFLQCLPLTLPYNLHVLWFCVKTLTMLSFLLLLLKPSVFYFVQRPPFRYINVQYLRDCVVSVWKESHYITKIVISADFSHQINSMS